MKHNVWNLSIAFLMTIFMATAARAQEREMTLDEKM